MNTVKVFRKMLDFLGQHGFYVCKDKEIVKNFSVT